MTYITELQIEKFAIELLENQGYQYIYAPDIAPDSETPERIRARLALRPNCSLRSQLCIPAKRQTV